MFRQLSGLGLVVALAIMVGYDAHFHFDAELVDLKSKNRSDQRNWSLFYDQERVYFNSPLRYEQDFKEIEKRIEPGKLVISDLATSYYAAVYLPNYVVNIHRHHGSWKRPSYDAFIKARYLCYLEFEENKSKVLSFIKAEPLADYILVNKDGKYSHRRQDCLAFRSHTLVEKLPEFSTLEYSGTYLNLYKLDKDYLPAR